MAHRGPGESSSPTCAGSFRVSRVTQRSSPRRRIPAQAPADPQPRRTRAAVNPRTNRCRPARRPLDAASNRRQPPRRPKSRARCPGAAPLGRAHSGPNPPGPREPWERAQPDRAGRSARPPTPPRLGTVRRLNSKLRRARFLRGEPGARPNRRPPCPNPPTGRRAQAKTNPPPGRGDRSRQRRRNSPSKPRKPQVRRAASRRRPGPPRSRTRAERAQRGPGRHTRRRGQLHRATRGQSWRMPDRARIVDSSKRHPSPVAARSSSVSQVAERFQLGGRLIVEI